MMYVFPQFPKVTKRGVTVLVAALVSSILLAIGLSIYNTTVKDLFFAATAKDSTVAFYAADTAAECAQFWDYPRVGALETFATTTPPGAAVWTPDTSRTCGGQPISSGWTVATNSTNPATAVDTTFNLVIPLSTGNAYATVTVTKNTVSSNTTITTIRALGYNSQTLTNNRTVQRGVEFSY